MQLVLGERQMHEGENKVHEEVANMWRREIKDYGERYKAQERRREYKAKEKK